MRPVPPLTLSRSAEAGHGWTVAVEGDTARVVLTGDWVARTDGVDLAAARQILASRVGALTFDARGLGHWDSALIAFLLRLRDAAGDGGVAFDEGGLPQAARRLLGLAPRAAAKASAPPGPPLLDRVGLWAIDAAAEAREGAALIGNLVLRGGMAMRGGAAVRASDIIEAMFDAGAAALPIVITVNLLVGGILAFIGATELRQFGAGLYVANLVGVGMVREMAALMTAIIMAGRTGGAYAADLAAMEGAEEIDALRAIGIPVFDYLILPRVAALTAMMPLLYLFGCAVGILGGLCVGAATLHITATAFFVQARGALSGVEFGLGLAKSLSFGALIAILSCRVGLRAGRSAAAVGQAATSAVVASIVGVIALDAMFDLCADVLGV